MTRLARKIKTPVKIQTATKTSNSSGGYTRVYSDLRPSFAGIVDLDERELVNNRNTGNTATARITMRWDPDIDEQKFIRTINDKYPERLFRVRGIKPMNGHEYLEIMAEEIEVES